MASTYTLAEFETLGFVPPPPANDDIANAIVITDTYHNELLDLRGATSIGDPVPSCVPNVNNSVWYQYTPPIDLTMGGGMIVNSFGNAVQSVWTGTPGSLSEVYCRNGAQPLFEDPLTGGTTYYIMVAGYNGDTGTSDFTFIASDAQMAVEAPADAATVQTTFNVTGWAVEPAKYTGGGPGIDLIRITEDNGGCEFNILAEAAPSIARPDVVAALGLDNSYLNSGFDIPITAPEGSLTFTVCARQTGSDVGPLTLWVAIEVRTVTVSDAPPPNANLVTNGDFANGEAGWTFLNDIHHQVVGEVLEVYRDASPSLGRVRQDLGYPAPAGTPFEVTLDLGNSSGVSKQMSLQLRDTATASQILCTFIVPAGAPLAPYTMRGETDAAWQDIRLHLLDQAPDGQPAFLIDNVDVRYRPDLTLSGTECLLPPNPPPNVPLLSNGDFSMGESDWRFTGVLNHSVVNEVMQMYRDVGSPSGVLAQVTGLCHHERSAVGSCRGDRQQQRCGQAGASAAARQRHQQ